MLNYEKIRYLHMSISELCIENITWLRRNMKFISSVEQDMSRVNEANE